jgi:hypothetical protein
MNLPLGTAVVGLVVGLSWPSLLAGAMFNRRAALGDVMGMDAVEFAKASLRASQLNAGPPALSSGDGTE